MAYTPQGGVSLTFCELSKNIFSKSVYCRNQTSDESFNLKFSPYMYVISGIVYFHKIILESLLNISKTTTGLSEAYRGSRM